MRPLQQLNSFTERSIGAGLAIAGVCRSSLSVLLVLSFAILFSTAQAQQNLTWIGSASADWDTMSVNWATNGNTTADTVFAPYDNVTFDDNGLYGLTVLFPADVTPGQVTVNSQYDYLFLTTTGNGIAGPASLTKNGTGILTLSMPNSYTGPTVINQGTLVLQGSGVTFGSGPITNHGILDFNQSKSLTLTNPIAGDGGIIKDGSGDVILAGANTMNASSITVNNGRLIVGETGLGDSTNIVVNGNVQTILALQGATIGTNVHLYANAPDNDHRVRIGTMSGYTNVWNGNLHLSGNAPNISVNFNSGDGNFFVGGTIDTDGSYNQDVTVRGFGVNVFSASINTPGMLGLNKTDSSTWIVCGANNSYRETLLALGTFQLGNDDAFATDCYFRQTQSGSSVLDLAGFNQTFSGITNDAGIHGHIANSSTNSDSRLTILPDQSGMIGLAMVSDALIEDSTGGGTRKVALTVNLPVGSLALTSGNTYSGDTTVEAGILALAGSGSIGNSSPIVLASGAALDASGRTDSTLTLNAGQVLKGDGTFNVTGNLVSGGTMEMKVGKSGAILSSDQLAVSGNLTYGGTLQLDITASPGLTTSDTFQLFSAGGGYNGAFALVIPATPGSGLSWDTSTLASDGVLRIATGPVAPTIATQPTNQSVVLGRSVSFVVDPAGTSPFTYQWQTNGIDIAGATNREYRISSAQFADELEYQVIVRNVAGYVTSDVATLTILIPGELEWIGTWDGQWNDTSLNWATNGSLTADQVFSVNDNVTFDDNGLPTVLVPGVVEPNLVTVNASLDYLFLSSTSGGVGGQASLVKDGSGTLTFNGLFNSYSGPTTIKAGTLELAGSQGTIGSGAITNDGVLHFSQTFNLTLDNTIAGTGSIVKDGGKTVALTGSNTMNAASITVNSGTFQAGSEGLGASTNIIVYGTSGQTVFGCLGTIGPDVHLFANNPVSSNKLRIGSPAGTTNTWNGHLHLSGAGPVNFNSGDDYFTINGTIDTDGSYTQPVTIRGAGGNNVFAAVMNTPGMLGIFKTDGGAYKVYGTNNSYLVARINAGTLRLGNDDALATNCFLQIDSGSGVLFNLSGHNQTLSGITTTVGNIFNYQTNNARLTILPDQSGTLGSDLVSAAVFGDNGVGAGTLSVTINLPGGSLALTSANIHSGDTTVAAGTLKLSGNGAIGNSSPIVLASGAALDASGRTDSTLTLNAGQVLKGDGTFNVTGNLVSDGTMEMKVGKSGAILSSDQLAVSGALTYGGTLQLDITASPGLTTSDAFQLFSAGGGYNGAFAHIVPATPGSGLSWDTSTLASDGVLRIATGPVIDTTPTNIVVSVSDGNLTLTWPTNQIGWTLQVQTNAVDVGISSNWVDVPYSDATNQMIIPIDPVNGAVFYRLLLNQ